MDQPKSPREPFEDAIRKRMEHHHLPVDKSVWPAIRRRLPAPSLRHKWLFPLLGGVAAAAVILLMIIPGSLFLPMSEAPDAATLSTVTPAVPGEKTTISSGISGTIPALPDDIELHEEINMPVVVKAAEDIHTNSFAVVPDTANHASTKPETKTATTASRSNLLQVATDDWTTTIPRKSRNNRMIAAVIGTGVGGSPATASHQPLDFRTEKMVSNALFASDYTYMLSPRDFSSREFLPPVSIGIKLRTPMSGSLAFETGIVYSFLMTRLSGGGWENLDATLQLHYLGVPLQLVKSVYVQGPWEINLSGGIMPEKGLRSVYHQYRRAGNTLITTDAYTRINGWQLSVVAGAGLSYHLQQHISLYIDPQLSWYFNMDQPFSVRTEMPLQIGVQAGLRIAL